MDIRPGKDTDLERINEIYNHFVLETPVTFDIEPITMDARRAWFAEFGGRFRLFVAVDGERVIGYAHSKYFRPKQAYETSVETTVYIEPSEVGKGLGKQLYSALFTELSDHDVHRAYAGITMPNDASVALHEKFGFRQVAYFTEQGRKFDKYWDVAWFEKEL